MSKIVEIIVFDDGNDEFKGYENRWTITKKMFKEAGIIYDQV